MKTVPEKHERVGRVSSASVTKATGKNWDQWIAILEKAGARHWTHGEIADYLKKRHKLRPWWQQGVALGFEIATGKRVDGQNFKGLYTVTATKSFAVDFKTVWRILLSEEGLRTWLKPLYEVAIEPGGAFETEDGFYGEVRTLKKERRIRLSWQDPNWTKATVVQVTIVPRPKGKSILVVDHSQLKDLQTKSRMGQRWRASLEALRAQIK